MEFSGAPELAFKIRAVSPADGDKSSVTLLIAKRVATSYYDSGMREYKALHDIYAADAKSETRASFDDFIRHAVPAVSNLSFALEVHMKVLHAQRIGHYPHGHRIHITYQKLPEPLKAALERRLVGTMQADAFPYLTKFSIEFYEVQPPGTFQFKLDCVDDNPPDRNSPNMFDSELAACDELYQRWRYVYERGIASGGVSARLFSLIHLNRAVAEEIESFSEGVVMSRQAD